MIYTAAVTKNMKLKENLTLDELSKDEIKWYWVDFHSPSSDEMQLLDTFFNFHPLAIEDCMHFLQRPKIDYYEDHNFLVLHSLNTNTLTSEELDVFIAKNYIVTFHNTTLSEIEECKKKFISNPNLWKEGTIHLLYLILDELVDNYFPVSYDIEDRLNDIDDIEPDHLNREQINKVFQIRSNLLKLRRVINTMKDLMYRIINSQHIEKPPEKHVYFHDIYDHLLRLSEIIESSFLVTSDIRDSYVSMNSDRMNKIMMFFTAITSIFVPLTFIVGIYGMNFDNMPELHWKYGYFVVLGLMGILAIIMLLWFKKKKWFDT